MCTVLNIGDLSPTETSRSSHRTKKKLNGHPISLPTQLRKQINKSLEYDIN